MVIVPVVLEVGVGYTSGEVLVVGREILVVRLFFEGLDFFQSCNSLAIIQTSSDETLFYFQRSLNFIARYDRKLCGLQYSK